MLLLQNVFALTGPRRHGTILGRDRVVNRQKDDAGRSTATLSDGPTIDCDDVARNEQMTIWKIFGIITFSSPLGESTGPVTRWPALPRQFQSLSGIGWTLAKDYKIGCDFRL